MGPVLTLYPPAFCQTCCNDLGRIVLSNASEKYKWRRRDTLPDLPRLLKAEERGCQFCGFIRKCTLALVARRPLAEYYELNRSSDGCNCGIYLELEDERWTAGGFRQHFDFNVPLEGEFKLGFDTRWVGMQEPEKMCTIKFTTKRPSIADFDSTAEAEVEDQFAPGKLNFMKRLLQFCDTSHPSCQLGNVESSITYPRRLIHIACSSPERGGRVELVYPESKSSGEFKYVALSYCWGRIPYNMPIQQEEMNAFNRSLAPLSVAVLPPLIRDAIEVARRLDINYIWIDELCIDQTDEEDQKREFEKMQNIYTAAYATIIVTSCGSNQESFRYRRKSYMTETPFSIQLNEGGQESRQKRLYLRLTNLPTPTFVSSTKWNTRGWTLQEDLLSRRKIFFTPGGLFFECHELQDVEDISLKQMPRPLPLTWFRDKLMPDAASKNDSIYHEWYKVVQNYSQRNLSKESDRLPAIQGLANRVAEMTGDKYHLGLFCGDAIRGLLWQSSVKTDIDFYNSREEKPDYLALGMQEWLSYFHFRFSSKKEMKRLRKLKSTEHVRQEWLHDLSLPTWSWVSSPECLEFPGEGEVLFPLASLEGASNCDKEYVYNNKDYLLLRGKLIKIKHNLGKKFQFYLCYLARTTKGNRMGLILYDESAQAMSLRSERKGPPIFTRISYFSSVKGPSSEIREFFENKENAWASWAEVEGQYWARFQTTKERVIMLL
ncbi:heterokaryon incompatibility protein-domain-containing protein [Halenospora varia]|nr:heterokaryon incompatibility protein-domain-containing protein [Halenospora varia]